MSGIDEQIEKDTSEWSDKLRAKLEESNKQFGAKIEVKMSEVFREATKGVHIPEDKRKAILESLLNKG